MHVFLFIETDYKYNEGGEEGDNKKGYIFVLSRSFMLYSDHQTTTKKSNNKKYNKKM